MSSSSMQSGGDSALANSLSVNSRYSRFAFRRPYRRASAASTARSSEFDRNCNTSRHWFISACWLQ